MVNNGTVERQADQHCVIYYNVPISRVLRLEKAKPNAYYLSPYMEVTAELVAEAVVDRCVIWT